MNPAAPTASVQGSQGVALHLKSSHLGSSGLPFSTLFDQGLLCCDYQRCHGAQLGGMGAGTGATGQIWQCAPVQAPVRAAAASKQLYVQIASILPASSKQQARAVLPHITNTHLHLVPPSALPPTMWVLHDKQQPKAKISKGWKPASLHRQTISSAAQCLLPRLVNHGFWYGCVWCSLAPNTRCTSECNHPQLRARHKMQQNGAIPPTGKQDMGSFMGPQGR